MKKRHENKKRLLGYVLDYARLASFDQLCLINDPYMYKKKSSGITSIDTKAQKISLREHTYSII